MLDYARDEADPVSLSGVDHAAGEHHVHRLRLTDRLGQADGAAHARRHAQLNFRLAELRLVRGDDHVAHHGQLTAAAERETIHRRNHRLAACCETIPEAEEVLDIHFGKTLRQHFLDVGTGSKGAALAGQHADGNVLVAVNARKDVGNFCHDLLVQRIQAVRPVDRDQRDAVRVFKSDRVVSAHHSIQSDSVGLSSHSVR